MNLPTSFSHDQYIFMTNFLKNDSVFLEYGSGNSTFLFSYFVKKYISIEHNNGWYSKVNGKIRKMNLKHIDHFYIPASDHQPHDHMDLEEFNQEKGSLLFFEYICFPEKLNTIFDFVFIDGRARVHCCNFMKKFIHKNSLIFFHDWERSYYHSVLESYRIVDQSGNLTVLSLK